MATHVAGPNHAGYEVSVLSPRRRVAASGGAALAVAALREVDVLVVPGFELGPGLDVDAKLAALAPEVAAIRSHAAAGNVVVSICVGAFLLAEAGLLNGRRATTAWLFADELARRCPDADVRSEHLVVTDAGVTTTAAFSAMYDFALDLIRRHSGTRVARTTARVALVDDARSSQTPYVDAPTSPPARKRVLPHGHATARPEPGRPIRPRRVGRHIQRQHSDAAAALRGRDRPQSARIPAVARASAAADTCSRPPTGPSPASAAAVGYKDSGTFAALFAKHTGRRPSDYRAAFRRGAG